MSMKNLIAGFAAAGLALAPLAAQANTRAAGSNASLFMAENSTLRIASLVGESEDDDERISPFIFAFIAGGVIFAIMQLFDAKGASDQQQSGQLGISNSEPADSNGIFN